MKKEIESDCVKTLMSFVVISRDVINTRLYNCLTTIRSQSVSAEQIEIILLDYGSDAKISKALAGIARRFEARYVYHDAPDGWNRGRAINLGCQSASSPLLAISDIDMAYRRNYAEVALNHYEACGQGPFYAHAVPFNSPRMEFTEEDVVQNFDRIAARSEARPTGKGNVVFSRSLFESLRGWEEEYCLYGCEDDDFFVRSRRSNSTFVDISNETSLIHQWHTKSGIPTEVTRVYGRNRAMYLPLNFRTPIIRTGAFGSEPPLPIHRPFESPRVAILVPSLSQKDDYLQLALKFKKVRYEDILIVLVNPLIPESVVESQADFKTISLSVESNDDLLSQLKTVHADIIGFMDENIFADEDALVSKVIVPLLGGKSTDPLGFAWWKSCAYDENHQLIKCM